MCDYKKNVSRLFYVFVIFLFLFKRICIASGLYHTKNKYYAESDAKFRLTSPRCSEELLLTDQSTFISSTYLIQFKQLRSILTTGKRVCEKHMSFDFVRELMKDTE